MFEKEFENSIANSLSLPDNQTARIMVGVSGDPVELLTRANKPYLIVNFIDNTGTVGVKIWDRVDEAKENFKSGSIWSVIIKKGTYEGNPQLSFVPGESTEIDVDSLEQEESIKILDKIARIYKATGNDVIKLFELVEKTGRQHIRDIFDHVFNTDPEVDFKIVISDFEHVRELPVKAAMAELKSANVFVSKEAFEKFKDFCYCPAAKGHHGAFIHGLLIHVGAQLDMITSMRRIYEDSLSLQTRPTTDSLVDYVDFDAIELMSMIHDYHKMDEYTWNSIGSIDYAKGKGETLFYHDMMIAFKLQAMPVWNIQDVKDPVALQALVDKITHGVMRHHGEWAAYQPSQQLKTFVESDIFHYIDVLDARIVGAIEG